MMERKLLFGKEKAFVVYFDGNEENKEQIELFKEEEQEEQQVDEPTE
jgi:hypothetical protein